MSLHELPVDGPGPLDPSHEPFEDANAQAFPSDDLPPPSDSPPGDDDSGFGAGLEGSGGGAATEGEAPKRKRRRRSRSSKSSEEAGAEGSADGASEDEAPRRKRTRTRRKASTGDAEDAPAADAPSAGAPDGDGGEDGDGDDGKPKKKRRRGSRGGRGRKRKSRAEEGDEPESEASDESEGGEASEADGEAPARKKAKRKRTRKKKTSDEDGGEAAEGDEPAGRSSRKAKKKSAKKKRTRKKSSRDEAEDGDAAEDSEAEGGAKKKRKRTRKKAASKEPEKTPEELEAEAEALRIEAILVNASDPEEKRVAVVGEDDRIHDLLMTAESQKTLVNDIYRGRVVNLEPAIGAAFIDFGQGRNGFLHTSDVLPTYGESGFTLDKLLTASIDPEDWSGDQHGEGDVDPSTDEDKPKTRRKRTRKKAAGKDSTDSEEGGEDAEGADEASAESSAESSDEAPAEQDEKKSKGKSKKGGAKGGKVRRRGRQRLPITDLLKVGDPVVVQVTKDAIGDKGPTLTTYISIPGRYLVLMPSMARTGVSRKIPDERERRRLKRILAGLNAPDDMGVIVRTAGVGRKKEDLKRDLEYLLGVWESFGKSLKSGRGPKPLYQESNLAIRTLRDLFDKTTKAVYVDDPMVQQEMITFAEKLMPEHVSRIQEHDGDRPIFHHHGIEQDFEKVFARRVELPSGGSIVFDQAEALVAIDVNSGRTRTDSHDFEEIALKTNLEAVPEIARQIKLRDLGGIIVCDFIDMMKSASNRQVERALRNALATDRARSKLGRISQFGLLEMTRQRLGPGTHKKVFQTCPRCRGTARIRTTESRAQAILRRLGSALSQKGFTTVEVRAHPEVIEYLREDLWDWIRAMEHRSEREIKLTEVPDQPEDSVLRYLRADGREVRPGGRRKR